MSRRVVFFHAPASSKRARAYLTKRGVPGGWLFFCPNYLRLRDWETLLGESVPRLSTGPLIGEAAGQLRGPFLELITAQGKLHQSIAWWASRVSERNTMVSPLFLNCCYLSVGERALREESGVLWVIAESWALMESLAEVAEGEGWSIVWASRRPRLGDRLRFAFATSKRILAFVGKALLETVRDNPSPQRGRPHVLLRTWIDESSLGQGGTFHDRYLPGLCAWLEAHGYAVSTIPVLFGLTRSPLATWRWLRHSNQRFINPFRYYRPADYLFAFSEARRQRSMPSGPAVLGKLQVTRLFAEARRFHAWDFGSLQAILSFRLPHRLAASGISIDIFIDPFENMIGEKPLIIGFRKDMPGTKLVGFQHGALSPNLLCQYVTKGESEFAPLPDRIVANGPLFRDILVEHGLPAHRVVAGPALRYQHLWRDARSVDGGARQSVLVPLPLMQSDAVELLTKLIQAFAGTPRIEIFLKLHPMASLTPLLSAARVRSLPRNFSVVGGDMGEWLARAQVVIALGTSALHEALAAGVPVVPAGRDAGLDLNTLGWYREFDKPYVSASEIREETLRLMQLSSEELARYRTRAGEILTESFGRVSDDAFRCFVDGLLPSGASEGSNLPLSAGI